MPGNALRAARRFIAVSFADRWLLAAALTDLMVTTAALRLVGFRRVLRHIERKPPLLGPDVVTLDHARRARRHDRSIGAAARLPLVGGHCLQRSLALHRVLRRKGLPSELRIGVRRVDGRLAAHAWVELGPFLVNDRPAAVSQFTPLRDVHALPGWAAAIGGAHGAAPRGSRV
ncbi:MAG TPA: lasso peptide biosynthesis B2 protein [Chloroflexota bacterium]|nr:lasso peptide biosynthesis B2 protein [Chloroflexota bacterium]